MDICGKQTKLLVTNIPGMKMTNGEAVCVVIAERKFMLCSMR